MSIWNLASKLWQVPDSFRTLALWSESGYFDGASDTKPLLHLWSLGVEEQFYIAWQFLVWLAWKVKADLVALTILVVCVSFLLNVYGVHHSLVATFYSPITRFWELSAGSLLAYLTLHRHIEPTEFSAFRANAIAFVGLALIVASVSFINRSYPFPGWWALLPILGSVCLITAGSKSWFNHKILSNKVCVWFGLISFPLYLWHWPLLSFGRVAARQPLGLAFRIVTVAVAVILAWLTYRFVERPIRRARDYRIVGILVAMAAILLCAGAYIVLHAGLPGRAAVANSGFNERVRAQFAGSLWTYSKNELCLDTYRYEKVEQLVACNNHL